MAATNSALASPSTTHQLWCFRNQVGKPKTAVNKVIDSMHLVGDELNEFDAAKV